MSENTPITEEEPYLMYSYTVARHQVWGGECKGNATYIIKFMTHFVGEYIHGSCAFGIRDLAMMIRRHELIAHKFYMQIEPAAYFCLWKMIKDKEKRMC